jgi:hypothetical protein
MQNPMLQSPLCFKKIKIHNHYNTKYYASIPLALKENKDKNITNECKIQYFNSLVFKKSKKNQCDAKSYTSILLVLRKN